MSAPAPRRGERRTVVTVVALRVIIHVGRRLAAIGACPVGAFAGATVVSVKPTLRASHVPDPRLTSPDPNLFATKSSRRRKCVLIADTMRLGRQLSGDPAVGIMGPPRPPASSRCSEVSVAAACIAPVPALRRRNGDDMAARRSRTVKRGLLSLLALLTLAGLLLLGVSTGLLNLVSTGFSQWFAGLLLNH